MPHCESHETLRHGLLHYTGVDTPARTCGEDFLSHVFSFRRCAQKEDAAIVCHCQLQLSWAL